MQYLCDKTLVLAFQTLSGLRSDSDKIKESNLFTRIESIEN